MAGLIFVAIMHQPGITKGSIKSTYFHLVLLPQLRYFLKNHNFISNYCSLINNKQMLQCQPPAQQPTKSCSSDVLASEDVDVNSLVTKPLVRSCFKEVNIIYFFLKEY